MGDSKAAVYVKNVPEFSLDEGLIHICHTAGQVRFEFVMRPNTFLRAVRAANRIADEFHAKGEVVQIKG